MGTNSLVYHIKMENFYIDIAEDVKERFATSGYDKADDRPLPIGVNKKVIWLRSQLRIEVRPTENDLT